LPTVHNHWVTNLSGECSHFVGGILMLVQITFMSLYFRYEGKPRRPCWIHFEPLDAFILVTSTVCALYLVYPCHVSFYYSKFFILTKYACSIITIHAFIYWKQIYFSWTWLIFYCVFYYLHKYVIKVIYMLYLLCLVL
jgi:hypothetical protein